MIDEKHRWLRANQEGRFDLILLNTAFHYRNHATNLLWREFLRLVKSRLESCVVIYLNTTGSPEVLKTATELMTRGSYYIVSDRPSGKVFKSPLNSAACLTFNVTVW